MSFDLIVVNEYAPSFFFSTFFFVVVVEFEYFCLQTSEIEQASLSI